MKRALGDLGVALLVATVVLGVLLASGVLAASLLLRVYLLVVAGIAMLAALAGARVRLEPYHRSLFDAVLHREPPADERPAQLARVERGVTLGVAHAFELHARLRPQLREIAEARLAIRRGIALDSPAGRAALGEAAWEVLRPDHPAPDDRFAPGIPPERLLRLVETLEEL